MQDPASPLHPIPLNHPEGGPHAPTSPQPSYKPGEVKRALDKEFWSQASLLSS